MARDRDDYRDAYWRANLRILTILLAIWAVAGFGLGIVAVPWLNRFQLGGFPLGFWFAQQGSILVFVVLIFVYARWMDRIERGMAPDDASATASEAPIPRDCEAPIPRD